MRKNWECREDEGARSASALAPLMPKRRKGRASAAGTGSLSSPMNGHVPDNWLKQ